MRGRRRTIALPYDGSPVGEAPVATLEDLAHAIEAAQEGAAAMAALSNGERSELLLRLRSILARDQAAYARLLTLETGKPIRESHTEAGRALDTIMESAVVARELAGEVIPVDAAAVGKGRMAITLREPLGVIGAITPFNLPLNLALHKVTPALAGGNAVVHKPAEQTPLTALRLAQAVEEAGFPYGAYNVITGDGEIIGQALVRDPRVAMITFTGSVPVGKWIRANAGLKRVTLELGNNSAVIVEPDADLELAISRCTQGAFAHSGQVCISVQRIFAHTSIAAEFTERLAAAASKLRIGHPLDEATDISSLVSEREAIRVEQWIAEAVAGGAKCVTGGLRQRATLHPTVLTAVREDARISIDEAFGPVVAVYSYDSLDDAILRVNETAFGLQAGIFTSNLQVAFSAARKIQTGGVLINDVPMFRADHMPYGGTKDSGIGREGPRYAIEEMTEMKLICWRA